MRHRHAGARRRRAGEIHPADVKVGALGLAAFTLTAARLVTIDGTEVATGTNIIPNPFSQPITQLIVANDLPVGHYAIEINGSGDNNGSDFTTRLDVTAVP